jgi:sodium-coupled monocarboxylate transporter 8/12
LYAFYHVHPERLDPSLFAAPRDFDKILPYFVINELPRPLPCVLIAAIFSASMGVTSSGINALTTATLVDFYQRLWRPNIDPARQLVLARCLTVMYGAIVLSLAFVIGRLGTLLEASNKAIGLAGGPLLGLFLLGMLSRRANAKGAVVGWIAGVAALLPIFLKTNVSFLWYAMIGCLSTMTVGWIASLLAAPPSPKQLEGLTFESRYIQGEEQPAQ